MLNPNDIENILSKIMDALPEGIRALPKDLRNNLKTTLQGVLSNLDLVTREEFDTQVAVLKRTREKLDALEQALQQKEQK